MFINTIFNFYIFNNMQNDIFKKLCSLSPYAYAQIKGGGSYAQVFGYVYFFKLPAGVIVMADVEGLPHTSSNIFAFHIHEGDNCDNNFLNTGGHFNPTAQHPNHAGDLPPLFSNNGQAWFAFYTERFNINDIIGRLVVVHLQVDDFTTQPAGNAGEKIACGKIVKI